MENLIKTLSLLLFLLSLVACNSNNMSDNYFSTKSSSAVIDDGEYRIQVKPDTTAAKQATTLAIGLMKSKKDMIKNELNHCSVTHIGNGYFITAGHCVMHDSDKDKFYAQIEYLPNRINSGARKLRLFVKEVYLHYRYKDSTTYNFGESDIALFKLDVNDRNLYGESFTGKISIFNTSTMSYPKGKITLTGYAADKKEGTLWTQDCNAEYFTKSIEYTCDTYNRTSGSPVYAYIQEAKDYRIIGIHSGTYSDLSKNYATRIDEEIYQGILNVIGEADNEYSYVFEKHKLTTKEYTYPSFKNTCHKPIQLIAYGHLADKGKTEVNGLYNIAPNQTILLDPAFAGDSFYYYAQTKDVKSKWEGTDHFDFYKGLKIGFRKIQLHGKRGMYIHTLSCD